MKFANLTPFGLTWDFSPGSTPIAVFDVIALANSIQYNRDILIHSVIGSGFISADAPTALGSVYGAYVLVDRDDATTRVINVTNQITSIIFGMVTMPNGSTGNRKADMNGQVHYRQPILVPAGKIISAYVMRNNNLFGSGRGLFTLLTEVL